MPECADPRLEYGHDAGTSHREDEAEVKSEFIAKNIWREITRSAKGAKKPSWVAVAYFAQGASRLLPLTRNSRLVVDASEGAVSSGQTCPFDLDKLMKRGVSIYSVPNLHAKVYVFDEIAYVGSANASNRSATHLIECVIRSLESGVIKNAKRFIQSLLIDELTPKRIEQLKRIYKQPRVPGIKGSHRKKISSHVRPEIPKLFIAQLSNCELSKKEEKQYDQGFRSAKKLQKYPKRFELDGFRVSGRCSYLRGNQVIQVLEGKSGQKMVYPPGYVRLIRRYPKKSFVYLEIPAVPRKSIRTLSKQLGSIALRKIKKLNGRVKNYEVAAELLTFWRK